MRYGKKEEHLKETQEEGGSAQEAGGQARSQAQVEACSQARRRAQKGRDSRQEARQAQGESRTAGCQEARQAQGQRRQAQDKAFGKTPCQEARGARGQAACQTHPAAQSPESYPAPERQDSTAAKVLYCQEEDCPQTCRQEAEGQARAR